MRVYTTGSLIALFFCSSCIGLDQHTSQTSTTKPLSRAAAFAEGVAGPLTELVGDLAPIAKAIVKEISNELPGDVTKIREDLFEEMSPAAGTKMESVPSLSGATAFAERVSGTLTGLVGELLPPVHKAKGEKVSSGLPGILAKVHEELFEHLPRALPSRKNSSPP